MEVIFSENVQVPVCEFVYFQKCMCMWTAVFYQQLAKLRPRGTEERIIRILIGWWSKALRDKLHGGGGRGGEGCYTDHSNESSRLVLSNGGAHVVAEQRSCEVWRFSRKLMSFSPVQTQWKTAVLEWGRILEVSFPSCVSWKCSWTPDKKERNAHRTDIVAKDHGPLACQYSCRVQWDLFPDCSYFIWHFQSTVVCDVFSQRLLPIYLRTERKFECYWGTLYQLSSSPYCTIYYWS